MRIGIATSNPNFQGGLLHELDPVREHQLTILQPTQDPMGYGYYLGQLCFTTDAVFCDFAQEPAPQMLSGHPGRVIIRAHRLEMYAPGIEDWPWERCACLVFIAEHVRERFMARLTKSRPQSVEVLPHVGVELGKFPFAERSWEPPYRIMLAGNIIPKKRQYTALQMLADMPEDVHLVMVGSAGTLGGYGNDEYPANISDAIEGLGLQGRVAHHEPVPQAQLASLMATCTWIGSWSNEEGCHTTVAEGMATGLLPLVSNWRGAADIYGADAIWKSPQDCYRRIEQFLEAEDEFRSQASQAAAEFAKRFDAGPINRRLADIIEGATDAQAVYAAHVPHQQSQYGNGRQQRCLALLLPQLGSSADGRYLDIGCGIGFVAAMAACRTSGVTGMDISPDLLQAAAGREVMLRGQLASAGLLETAEGTQWVCGDVACGLPEGPWHVISMFDSLEHVPTQNRQAALANVAKALEPGGRFLLTFPWQGGDAAQSLEWPVYPKTVAQFLWKLGLEQEENGPLDEQYWFMRWRKPATNRGAIAETGNDE